MHRPRYAKLLEVVLSIRRRHDQSYRRRVAKGNRTIDEVCWCGDCYRIRCAIEPDKTREMARRMATKPGDTFYD
jgi:hypothetical protein